MVGRGCGAAVARRRLSAEALATKRRREVRRAFLAALGSRTLPAFEESVVERIAATLGPRPSIPIRLAGSVSSFQIVPRPVFDEKVPTGRLTFDRDTGQFTITLNPRPHQRVWLDDDPSLSLQPFLRFAYAHEVAHRFFFVERDGLWERVLERTTQGISTAALRDRAVLELYRLEEDSCNRIAGRVLVPDRALADSFCAAVGSISREARAASCGALLGQARAAFEVPLGVLLVSLSQGVDRGRIQMPPGLVLFSAAQRGRGLAVDIAVTRGGLPGRLLYPGMPLQRLGPELARVVWGATQAGQRFGRFEAVRIPDGAGAERLVTGGWWRNGTSASSRIVVWCEATPDQGSGAG